MALAFWQEVFFTDLVSIWSVTHPNDGQGNEEDDVITLSSSNVRAMFLFADNVGNPTDVGRVRAFSLRRATTCYLEADTPISADWFIKDLTPNRPASGRFVYRVQEQPAIYPTSGDFDSNMAIVMIEHDPHPPEEIT